MNKLLDTYSSNQQYENHMDLSFDKKQNIYPQNNDLLERLILA